MADNESLLRINRTQATCFLGLWLALGAVCLPADLGRLAQCSRQWQQVSYTVAENYEFAETLAQAYDQLFEYQGQKPFPTKTEWKVRQRFLGNRTFRGSYNQEKQLNQDFVQALRAIEKSPNDLEAHRQIAEVAQRYLEKTGVPTELTRHPGGAYEVVVVPMLPKRWREWAREKYGDGAGKIPELTILSQRAKLRNTRLIFLSSDLKSDSHGSFHDTHGLSLGIGQLFGNQTEGTFAHEATHEEHFGKAEVPWSKELARQEDKRKVWLPLIKIYNGPEPGTLKDTTYAEVYFAEEGESCLREATQAFDLALRLKGIVSQGHHPEAQRLLDIQTFIGRNRLEWALKFSKHTDETLSLAVSSSKPSWAESDPGKFMLGLSHQRSLTLGAAQFPGVYEAHAENKLPQFLQGKLRDVKAVVELLKNDTVELQTAFDTEFPR